MSLSQGCSDFSLHTSKIISRLLYISIYYEQKCQKQGVDVDFLEKSLNSPIFFIQFQTIPVAAGCDVVWSGK